MLNWLQTPTAQSGRVLLVTAHPDDEVMFFAPTILLLQRSGAAIFILCLSTGNADGLGAVRQQELFRASSVLGIDRDHVRVVDDPRLQDGMSVSWPTAIIQQYIREQVGQAAIDTVVSFDSRGVSGHCNHIATCKGLRYYIEECAARRERGAACTTPRVYLLCTTGVIRKFWSVLDVPCSMLEAWLGICDACLVWLDPMVVLTAMQAHQSQFVWYRKLFISLSRYTYVNTLKRIA